MNSKGLIAAMVLIVLIGGIYMWKGGSTTVAPIGDDQTGVQVSEEQTPVAIGVTGSIGKMTDDTYVEIAAQIAYGASNPVALANNNSMEKLFSKYDVTEENYTAYGEELSKDANRAGAVMQKYSLRLQELQKTGN